MIGKQVVIPCDDVLWVTHGDVNGQNLAAVSMAG